MGPLGTTEIIVIVLIILLLFGARKLPELLRSMGEGVREFRKASREIMEDIETADIRKPEKPRPRPQPAPIEPAPVERAEETAATND
jgi:sec-independent protein translocase protein TatA